MRQFQDVFKEDLTELDQVDMEEAKVEPYSCVSTKQQTMKRQLNAWMLKEI